MTEPAIGQGIITADPTIFIALSWGFSFLFIGGLIVHALMEFRNKS